MTAFALGAGSIAIMAVITIIMVWELTPSGQGMVKLVGYGLIALGVLILVGPIQGPFN